MEPFSKRKLNKQQPLKKQADLIKLLASITADITEANAIDILKIIINKTILLKHKIWLVREYKQILTQLKLHEDNSYILDLQKDLQFQAVQAKVIKAVKKKIRSKEVQPAKKKKKKIGFKKLINKLKIDKPPKLSTVKKRKTIISSKPIYSLPRS